MRRCVLGREGASRAPLNESPQHKEEDHYGGEGAGDRRVVLLEGVHGPVPELHREVCLSQETNEASDKYRRREPAPVHADYTGDEDEELGGKRRGAEHRHQEGEDVVSAELLFDPILLVLGKTRHHRVALRSGDVIEHEGAENRPQSSDDGDKEEVRRTLPAEQHHHQVCSAGKGNARGIQKGDEEEPGNPEREQFVLEGFQDHASGPRSTESAPSRALAPAKRLTRFDAIGRDRSACSGACIDRLCRGAAGRGCFVAQDVQDRPSDRKEHRSEHDA